jgi:hypothetical protein
MTEIPTKRTPETVADERILEILRAIDSWAADATAGLDAAVRAVCLRLAEMIADQRHHHLLHPEPLDPDQQRVLELVAEHLRTAPVMRGLERELHNSRSGLEHGPGPRSPGRTVNPMAILCLGVRPTPRGRPDPTGRTTW